MINQIYVDLLSLKIFTNEINPKTNFAFSIDDILREEYKQPVLDKIKILVEEQSRKESNKVGN